MRHKLVVITNYIFYYAKVDLITYVNITNTIQYSESIDLALVAIRLKMRKHLSMQELATGIGVIEILSLLLNRNYSCNSEHWLFTFRIVMRIVAANTIQEHA